MHFFTEPNLLVPQTDVHAYGPVKGNTATQYNIGSTFTVSSKAKVFAVQDCMMIIQPNVSDSDLVNIILKPLKGLKIKFSSIKYYIYRGVDKKSFIKSGLKIQEDSFVDKTDFIDKFWKNWDTYITSLPSTSTIPPDPTAYSFGFKPSLSTTMLLEEIFNSEESSNTVINDLQAIKVLEGEWIGNILATNEFNFEIITDTDHLVLDLAYAQKNKHIIDISSVLSSSTNLYLDLDHIAEREKVLNYIDPAAFFGLHYETKVDIYDASTSNKKSKKNAEEVIDKFHTKNTVYLDIRNEKGYSYNFYQNYGIGPIVAANHNFLNIKNTSHSTFYEVDFKTINWPIFALDSTSFDSQGMSFNQGEKLNIQLRIDDNNKPLLFAENPKLFGKGNRNHFKKEKDLLDNLLVISWTKTITIEFPFAMVGSNKTNIAHHIKLQYFRQEDNPASSNTVLKSEGYVNKKFKIATNKLPSIFKHWKENKLSFMNGGGFSYVGNNGIYHDSTNVVLYTKNIFSLKRSNEVFPKLDTSSEVGKSLVSSSLFPEQIVFNKWRVNESAISSVDILDIVGFNQNHLATNLEDIFMLGLTQIEYETLDNELGLSDFHSKFILLDEIPNQSDFNTGTPFKKYKIRIQGLDNSGIAKSISPASDIFVYATGMSLFCSKKFAASTDLPNVLPDPSTFEVFEYTKKISYDKSHPIITTHPDSIISSGTVEVDDIGNAYKDDKVKVELRGYLCYPIEKPSDVNIHPRESSYPLVVIIHGNGQEYFEYEYYANLCSRLAKNGFIALSIDCLISEGEVAVGSTSGTGLDTKFPTFTHYFYFDTTRLFIYKESPEEIKEVKGSTIPTLTLHDTGWIKGTHYEIDSPPTKLTLNKGHFPKGHHMGILGRSNLLFPHLKIIKNKFGNKVANNIGLLGHSRGGEAVVRAAKDIGGSSAPTDLKNINAIISLAPTDQWDIEELTQHIPYFVLYGSKDGDVAGNVSLPRNNKEKKFMGTGGFSLYDRAKNNTEKSMAFVYGATHNGFIKGNTDYTDALTPTILETKTTQQKILKAYMSAFFRIHLKNESIWKPIFYGDYIPTSIPRLKSSNGIFLQHRTMNSAKTIYDFDGLTSISIGNSPGQISLDSGFSIEISEFNKRATSSVTGTYPSYSYTTNNDTGERKDIYSPHFNKGLYLKYPSSGGKVRIHLKSSQQNANNFEFISFRICHVTNLTLASYPDLSQLKVFLSDGTKEHFQVINKKIPKPDNRGPLLGKLADKKSPDEPEYTKSALITIRIPLIDFSNHYVDLSQLSQIIFEFPATTSGGYVDIDDIEFTN